MKKCFIVIAILACAGLLFAQTPVNWTLVYQVRIKAATPQGQFNDAIYFTPAAYAKLTVTQINTQVKARIDNWIYVVTHPTPAIEPTKEDLLEQVTGDLDRLDDVITRVLAKSPAKLELDPVRVKLQAYVDRLAAVKTIAVEP